MNTEREEETTYVVVDAEGNTFGEFDDEDEAHVEARGEGQFWVARKDEE